MAVGSINIQRSNNSHDNYIVVENGWTGEAFVHSTELLAIGSYMYRTTLVTSGTKYSYLLQKINPVDNSLVFEAIIITGTSTTVGLIDFFEFKGRLLVTGRVDGVYYLMEFDKNSGEMLLSLNLNGNTSFSFGKSFIVSNRYYCTTSTSGVLFAIDLENLVFLSNMNTGITEDSLNYLYHLGNEIYFRSGSTSNMVYKFHLNSDNSVTLVSTKTYDLPVTSGAIGENGKHVLYFNHSSTGYDVLRRYDTDGNLLEERAASIGVHLLSSNNIQFIFEYFYTSGFTTSTHIILTSILDFDKSLFQLDQYISTKNREETVQNAAGGNPKRMAACKVGNDLIIYYIKRYHSNVTDVRVFKLHLRKR